MHCLKPKCFCDKNFSNVSEFLGSSTRITCPDGEAIRHLYLLPFKKLRFFSFLAFLS